MKSILYIQDYPPCEGGGIEVQTFEDAKYLAALGHNVTILSTRARSETYTSTNEHSRYVQSGVHIYIANSLSDLQTAIDIANVVHIQATFSLRPGMMSAMNYLCDIQKPYYITLRTSSAHIPFSRLSLLSGIERGSLLQEFAKYLSSPLVTVLGVSQSLQSSLKYLGVSTLIRVLHNARDWENTSSIELESRPRAVDISYIGEISVMKGVDSLIRAIYELRNRDIVLSARIIGNGQDTTMICSLAESLGVQDCIEFLPYIKHELIANYLSSTSILVLPSLTETWGNIVMEAMAAGTPVVCSDCEGLVELTANGQYATLFRRGSVVELTDALEQVLDNYSQVQLKSKHAQQYVTKTYTMQKRIETLTELYK